MLPVRPLRSILFCVLPVALLGFSACSWPWGGASSSDSPENAKKAGAVLAEVSTHALSDACANGGVDIELGVDLNADGELSADEVNRILTVCHGTTGANAMADVESVGPGDACPTGGVRVVSGVDANGNDELEDNEILRSELLCNGAVGANGLTSIVRIEPQEPNDACPAGGIEISSGLDVDGDGELSVDETSQSAFLCHGADGEDGFSTLTVTDDEVGDACDAFGHGGQRFRTGLDNGDGEGTAHDDVLHDDEVDSTVYVCNGASGPQGPQGDAGPQGPIGPRGDAGVAGADGYTTISLMDDEVGTSCDATGTGGTRIRSGLDNGDGEGIARDGSLHADEVDATIYVCNGATGQQGDAGQAGEDGFTTLTTTDTVIGTACDSFGNGGQRIRTGLDNGDGSGTAADGILHEDEVDATMYICNGGDGQTGEAGVAGKSSLVRTDIELGGPNCLYGGVKILSGIDDDDNGTLEGEAEGDQEVDSVAYVCGMVPGDCAADYHDGGDGRCLSVGTCISDYHDGGDGSCVPTGTCVTAYHDGGTGACVALGSCSTDYHDGGDGSCVAVGTCLSGYHDGGDGSCVATGTCTSTYHDGGTGACVPEGTCSSGYHDGGDGVCLRSNQVSAGVAHNCGINGDGSILCWGSPYIIPDVLNAPTSGNFVSVSAGTIASCAIDDAGAIHCWGRKYTYGEVTPPSGTFVSVSVGPENPTIQLGLSHACAIRENGSTVCWPDKGAKTAVPEGNFVSVAAGEDHSCGIKKDGSAHCWGSPASIVELYSPPEGVFTEVVMHKYNACALRDDNTGACWGPVDYLDYWGTQAFVLLMRCSWFPTTHPSIHSQSEPLF